MAKKRLHGLSPDDPESTKPVATLGGFAQDGSWDKHGDPASARSRFVWDLCRERRRTQVSPRAVAIRIHASHFRDMFGDLTQWLDLSSPDDWPRAIARTTSAQATIHEGRGGSGCEWGHGHWLPTEPRKPDVSRPEYAALRFEIITGIRDHGWTPAFVASMLGPASAKFPEIESSEIDLLRSMASSWNRQEAT